MALALCGDAAHADHVLVFVASRFDRLERAPESSVLGHIVARSRTLQDAGSQSGQPEGETAALPDGVREVMPALAALSRDEREAWCLLHACARPIEEVCAALALSKQQVLDRAASAERLLRARADVRDAAGLARATSALRVADAAPALERVAPRLGAIEKRRRTYSAAKLGVLIACMALMLYVGLDLWAAGTAERKARSAGELIGLDPSPSTEPVPSRGPER